MNVTVAPETFQFVEFDPELTRRVAADLATALGLERPVSIEIDETSPLSRMWLDVGDTIVVRADSGAFEDTRNPRRQSETNTSVALGRMLLRARDRLSGGFGEAPADSELTLAEVSAWDTYSAGRLQRLGLLVNEQRWRYDFRNRHGFSDTSDAAFDRLWSSDGLTWAELDAISHAAAA